FTNKLGMVRGSKRGCIVNQAPRGRPRGRGSSRGRGRGREAWNASNHDDLVGRSTDIDDEELKKRRRRAERYVGDREVKEDNYKVQSANEEPSFKYPVAERFLRDYLIRQATDKRDVGIMRTAARFITIPKSGPRHRAHDFFLNVSHLQRLSEYGDAESIMRAELQAQRTELLEIIRRRSKIEIYAECSPDIEKQSDQPVLHGEDSDVEMGEAEPLVESPISAVTLTILDNTPVKNVDEFDGSSDGLSPMDVDEEYRESLRASVRIIKKTSLSAAANTRRPARRVSFNNAPDIIDGTGQDNETVNLPPPEYTRKQPLADEAITEEAGNVRDDRSIIGSYITDNNVRLGNLDDTDRTTGERSIQKRDTIPDSPSPMVFNIRTRTYLGWTANSCGLLDCPFHVHKQPKWVHDMLVKPPTFHF
ncbi:1473_t:CDS:2, partial [Paraglomus occultum]